MTPADVRAGAEAAGLALRGAFRLSAAERVGPLQSADWVVLLGFIGAGNWPAFAASPEASDGRDDPLDRWSRRVIAALGELLRATPLFPFDGPPYWPFQAWARRAEPVFPSPLGMLVHPVYGLSHSYRGALAFAEALDWPSPTPMQSPCDTCAGRPCLSACPVGAFTPGSYDIEACVGWLRTPKGETCLGEGCQARGACPVGREHAQSPEQARFHMAAFLAARG